MPNIYQQAQSFRRDLETGANNTAAIMIKAYGELWAERIKPEIDSLTAEIEDDIAEGKDPARARLERQARFTQLEQDIANEMERLRTQFAELIDQDVRSVAERAEREAQDLMVAGIGAPPGVNVAGVFNRVNTDAMEQITGVLQPGSPLRKILDPLGDDAASGVGKALKAGVGLGRSPRAIAREARQALGGNMARALTIARTETIRAYREASRATYQANKKIVPTWLWLSARQARTCGVCFAMHGTEHSVDTPQGSHPNCRCTMVPKTISYEDLAKEFGLPAPPEGWPSGPNVEALVGSGEDFFNKLSDEDQLRILGPSKFAAFKAGALKLGDLVAEHEDPDWGLVRGEKSLGALGLPRVKMGEALAQKAPTTEIEQIRNEILAIRAEAQARAADLEAELAAMEAQYKELMAAYNDLAGPYGRNVTKLNDEEFALYKQLQKDSDEARAALTARRNQYLAEQRDFTARQRALLYVDDPAHVKPKGSKQALSRHADGIDEFNRLVSASTIDPTHQHATPTITSRLGSGRSYYSSAKGEVHMQRDSDRTVVHEFGHWWEYQNPQAHQAVLDFLDRRTAGENAQWLGPGYGRDEMAKPDQFISPYMGKIYMWNGKQHSSEIVSMGLEWFYANPAELAERDPDYFDFIYNLVRGNY